MRFFKLREGDGAARRRLADLAEPQVGAAEEARLAWFSAEWVSSRDRGGRGCCGCRNRWIGGNRSGALHGGWSLLDALRFEGATGQAGDDKDQGSRVNMHRASPRNVVQLANLPSMGAARSGSPQAPISA